VKSLKIKTSIPDVSFFIEEILPGCKLFATVLKILFPEVENLDWQIFLEF
jgi:hypothetical protein